MSREFKLRAQLDEKNQIIKHYIQGDVDEEDTIKLSSMTETMVQSLKNPEKVRMLVVVEKSGKPTPKARKKFLKDMKRPNIHKFAVVASNPFAKAFFTLYKIASGSSRLRMFGNEQDALEWLKE